MIDSLKLLEQIIIDRKDNPQEKSYTSYLFEKGIDKILKKCGEECSEVIIAAKNKNNDDTANEICDLLYHLMVLMASENISLNEIDVIMSERAEKIGNLKTFHEKEAL